MLALDDRQRRELWGLALLALALLLTLSLFPLALLGLSGVRLFPSGNIVGAIGGQLAALSWALLGVAALLVPIVPAVWGLWSFDRLSAPDALRWTTLLAGGVLLLPTAAFVLFPPLGETHAGAGWLGGSLGSALAAGFGWVGAALVLAFAFAALCVATVGWNPLRSAVSGSRFAWHRARGAVGHLPRPRFGTREPEAPGVGGEAEGEPPPTTLAADEEATVLEADVPTPAAKPVRDRKRTRTPESQPEVVAEDTGDPLAADLPSTSLLDSPPPRDEGRSQRELEELGRVLVGKLATFKIAGQLVGMTTGPVVTQFEVSPAPGIKVSRIANLEADLALAMRAPSVRILAPIPGKGAVGVEVPNPAPEMVFFREVLEAAPFRGSKAQLPLALGKDISGQPYVADLARMPHLLIAGATGSGKSVCINTIITSLIYRHSPQTLRLLMVDPKMVELIMYNDLPHLRHPVVTDNQDAAGVLKWAVLEMERRYELLSVNGVRNLQDFNKRLADGQILRSPEADGEEGDPDRWIYRAGPLPYIVVVIDELADLMMTVQGEVEKPLALLAQKARAIGIHLILATQRPSVNVITGLIKANFPSRIAFRVSSKIDSRTILDQNGADALLGNGDMLFLPPGAGDPVRVQGAYLSTEETEHLMGWYREQAERRREEALASGSPPEVRGEEDILAAVRAREGGDEEERGEGALEDRDKLFREAAELCIQHQGGSTSLLQRRLRIGYGRAARIVDQLHYTGVLGPPDGSKPREVMVDLVSLDQIAPD